MTGARRHLAHQVRATSRAPARRAVDAGRSGGGRASRSHPSPHGFAVIPENVVIPENARGGLPVTGWAFPPPGRAVTSTPSGRIVPHHPEGRYLLRSRAFALRYGAGQRTGA